MSNLRILFTLLLFSISIFIFPGFVGAIYLHELSQIEINQNLNMLGYNVSNVNYINPVGSLTVSAPLSILGSLNLNSNTITNAGAITSTSLKTSEVNLTKGLISYNDYGLLLSSADDVKAWFYSDEIYIGGSSFTDSIHLRGAVDQLTSLSMSGNIDMNQYNLTEVGLINGVNISALSGAQDLAGVLAQGNSAGAYDINLNNNNLLNVNMINSGAPILNSTIDSYAVTTISAGTGLSGGGGPGAVSIAADTTYLQRRVSGTCSEGNAIRVINADGTVTCVSVGGGGGGGINQTLAQVLAEGNSAGDYNINMSNNNITNINALSPQGSAITIDGNIALEGNNLTGVIAITPYGTNDICIGNC